MNKNGEIIMKKYIEEMVKHTDLWPWYWLSYGEKCYAFAVVEAFPLVDNIKPPKPGSRLTLLEKDGKVIWVGEGDIEMIIESEIANIEQQNGDTICQFIAAAHTELMKEHLNLGSN